MNIEEGEFGGTDVELIAGDHLDDIPETHKHLISDGIRDAFADPCGQLKSLIDRCPFHQMKTWLTELHVAANWKLQIHLPDYDQPGEAGFWWSAAAVRGARIHPSIESAFPVDYPQDFRTYYDLVDTVDWNGFGAAGRFFGADGQTALSSLGVDVHGADLDPDDTYFCGNSPCGDMLIWTMDGRGGWFAHGSHKIHVLGSIADTIDWVYSELINHRCPEWDYRFW